ncbi:MAG: hypothetical protein ACRYFU_19035, partial [Janthinobacterium lividum]
FRTSYVRRSFAWFHKAYSAARAPSVERSPYGHSTSPYWTGKDNDAAVVRLGRSERQDELLEQAPRQFCQHWRDNQCQQHRWYRLPPMHEHSA